MTDNSNKKEILATFEKWGIIDDDNNLKQKDNKYFKGRVLVEVTEKDKDSLMEYYVSKFDTLREVYEEIKNEYENNTNKKSTFKKVNKFIEFIDRAAAIGDFDTLIDNVKAIQDAINKEFEENYLQKEKVCEEIAAMIDNNEFNVPVATINQMKEKFALIGYVPIEKKDIIQYRFQSLLDDYFTKRKEYQEEREETKLKNLELKKSLCEEAEKLSTSENWKETTLLYKELQTRWQEIGEVPVENINDIWNRFKKANDIFFANRQNYYDEQDQIRKNNLVLKEKLCEKAETLSESDNWSEVTIELIELQKEWKTIGPVPWEDNDAIWERFKKANDQFFDRKTEYIINEKNQRIENLKLKEKLCAEVEELAELKGFDTTNDQVAEIKKKWIEIGPVPRDKAEEIGLRFSEACKNALKK